MARNIYVTVLAGWAVATFLTTAAADPSSAAPPSATPPNAPPKVEQKELDARRKARWAQTRPRRKLSRQIRLFQQWGDDLLRQPRVQKELQIHAERTAKLHFMMRDLVKPKDDKTRQQVNNILRLETRRHTYAMSAFRAAQPARPNQKGESKP